MIPEQELEQALDTVLECPEKKVFDWEKAASIINKYHIRNAEAFISDDEVYTAGRILDNGKPVLDHEAFLETYKGTPILRDMDTHEEYTCYKKALSTNWSVNALMTIKGED